MPKWLSKVNPFKLFKSKPATVSPANSTKQVDRSASGFRKTGFNVILVSALAMSVIIIYDLLNYTEERTQIWECVYTIGINLAAAGITIGVGTILYGHFDFVQYVRNSLCKILFEYEFVDNLNDDEKSKLMRKLQKDLIYHDKESGNNTLFDFVNNELTTLTQGPYYESIDAYFHCKTDGNIIEKHILRRLVINIEQAPDYRYDLSQQTRCYFFRPPEMPDIITPYEILHLTINSQDLDFKIERKFESVKDERGYHIVSYYKFIDDFDVTTLYEGTDIITIELEYITRVYSSDKSLVFRTYFPCKKLHASFMCDDPLSVHPDIFCFKGRSSSGLSRDFIHVHPFDSSVHIDISDWMLPGDGIIYLLELNGINPTTPMKESSLQGAPELMPEAVSALEEAERIVSEM